AVRLRNPPVRGRGREARGPGAGPCGADAAGDAPDLRSPAAVTVLVVASGDGGLGNNQAQTGLPAERRSMNDGELPSPPRHLGGSQRLSEPPILRTKRPGCQ